jgi:hypothetical protein
MARRRPARPSATTADHPPVEDARRSISRVSILLTGLLLGLALGVLMCVVLWAVGRLEGGDTYGWAYRIAITALIGMVMATIIGPVRVARAEGTLAPRRRLFGRRRS